MLKFRWQISPQNVTKVSLSDWRVDSRIQQKRSGRKCTPLHFPIKSRFLLHEGSTRRSALRRNDAKRLSAESLPRFHGTVRRPDMSSVQAPWTARTKDIRVRRIRFAVRRVIATFWPKKARFFSVKVYSKWHTTRPTSLGIYAVVTTRGAALSLFFYSDDVSSSLFAFRFISGYTNFLHGPLDRDP